MITSENIDGILTVNQLSITELIEKSEQLKSNGKVEEALRILKNWLSSSVEKNKHLIWFNLGTMLQGLNRSDEAIEAYQQCLKIQPTMCQASINYGLLLEKLGDNNGALQAWSGVIAQQFLQNNPSQEMQTLALNHIGRLYENLKDYDQAENALTREQTIRGMTIWAAKAAFLDKELGSLEAGKKADFIILNNDLMQIPEQQVLLTKPIATYLVGKKVFGK